MLASIHLVLSRNQSLNLCISSSYVSEYGSGFGQTYFPSISHLLKFLACASINKSSLPSIILIILSSVRISSLSSFHRSIYSTTKSSSLNSPVFHAPDICIKSTGSLSIETCSVVFPEERLKSHTGPAFSFPYLSLYKKVLCLKASAFLKSSFIII